MGKNWPGEGGGKGKHVKRRHKENKPHKNILIILCTPSISWASVPPSQLFPSYHHFMQRLGKLGHLPAFTDLDELDVTHFTDEQTESN